MKSYNQKATPFVLNNYISVQVAAKYSGYSLQYLRRLLRIGQLWLIDKSALDACLRQARNTTDQRFGPK